EPPETSKRVVMAPPPTAGALEPPRHREPSIIEATGEFSVEQIDSGVDELDEELDADEESASASFGNVVTPARPAPTAPKPVSYAAVPPSTSLQDDEGDEFDDDEEDSARP